MVAAGVAAVLTLGGRGGSASETPGSTGEPAASPVPVVVVDAGGEDVVVDAGVEHVVADAGAEPVAVDAAPVQEPAKPHKPQRPKPPKPPKPDPGTVKPPKPDAPTPCPVDENGMPLHRC
jgi:hypothetical protein